MVEYFFFTVSPFRRLSSVADPCRARASIAQEWPLTFVSTIILKTYTDSEMGSSLQSFDKKSWWDGASTVERCGTTMLDWNGWNLDDFSQNVKLLGCLEI